MSTDTRTAPAALTLVDAPWSRSAATWSLPVDIRRTELAACVHEAVGYCDPQGCHSQR